MFKGKFPKTSTTAIKGNAVVYLGPPQTYMMELSSEIVNGR